MIEPLLPGAHDRVIYAVASLSPALIGPWEENEEYRMSRLRRDLDRFSLGSHITVGHGEDENCDMKPLDPKKDEVWEYRSRAPKPSFRVFGRFAEQDVLIVTNMERRDRLGHKRSREWAVEIATCRAEWAKLFPYCDPHRGEKIHDYIKDNVTDLRDIEKR